ncbi:MAG: type II toxin-antitoxin system VapC family toxin [Saprospiraceae bacterium]|nr:type II toxin-antitoxin system VapC family toxin [Saprospiraceae bacterium]
MDTNLIVIYSRENDFSKQIEKRYKLFTGKENLYISTVSIGELNAIIKKSNIGKRKQRKIAEMLEMIDRISIEHEEIIDKYGDIDAFSQGKLKLKGHQFSARNMGKSR